MGMPSRQRMEFKLNIRPGGGRGAGLPDTIRYRLEKDLKRRAEALGLRVYSVRAERGKITIDALFQGHMVKSNIERAIWGAINGIFKKEMPHMVKKGSRSPGGFKGFDYY